MRFGFLPFRQLARRDVAPRADDLLWFAVRASGQMLFVINPAIGAILTAKTILHRVCTVLEQCGDFILHASQIVGEDSLTPDGWVLQVLGWRVAEHADDIVADKGRRIIAGRLETIDHR